MRHILIGIFALAALAPAPAFAQVGESVWPGGRSAAIVLTYDDALVSQLDYAVPQLNAAGLRGTFYLTGRSPGLIIARWREAAAAGHELGNHTINHSCARASFEMAPQYQSENLSVAVLLEDIAVMERLLEAIDGRTRHSFATPCGQNLAGGEDYLAPLIASGAVGAIRDERAPYPANTPPAVAAAFVGESGAQMIAWVEAVRARGALGVIVFHGVGGDYLAVSAEAHQQLLDYLRANASDIWVTTFSEAIAHAAP